MILDRFLSDNSNQPPKVFARMEHMNLRDSGDNAWHTVSAPERSARIKTVVAILTSFASLTPFFPDSFPTFGPFSVVLITSSSS